MYLEALMIFLLIEAKKQIQTAKSRGGPRKHHTEFL